MPGEQASFLAPAHNCRHGISISAFVLKEGTKVTVLQEKMDGSREKEKSAYCREKDPHKRATMAVENCRRSCKLC